MKRNTWSVEEEKLLNHYLKKGYTKPEIAKILQRTPKSVENKIWSIKISKK